MSKKHIDPADAYIFRIGKEDFEACVPCDPTKSKRLMEKWDSEPCEVGSELFKRHEREEELWIRGWQVSSYIAANYIGP